MRLILLFTILLLFSNTIIAERTIEEKEAEKKLKEDQEDHRKELLEQLLSPIANERLLAAVELQPLITQKELEKWFYGYDERYREDGEMKTRHIEHDWLILTNFLAGGWPLQADFLQDAFLSVKEETLEEKQYIYVFAGFLFDHRKLKNINTDAVINTYIRNEFYKDYTSRCSYSMLWKEKYQHVANTPWLKEKFLADTWISFSDKIIVKYFSGELTEEYAQGSQFGKMLYKAIVSNEIPEVDVGYESGVIQRVDFAFIIANLLGKTEWFKPIQDSLKNGIRIGWFVGPDGKDVVGPHKVDLSNEVFDSIIALLDNDIEKCKSILGKYLVNTNLSLDPRVAIHHELFKKLRESQGFKEWFEDLVHRYPIIDPDPSFQVIDWWDN